MDSLQINPVFNFPGDAMFKSKSSLVIDEKFLLQKRTCRELGKTTINTTTLTLRAVPESDIEWILVMFRDIKHLKLDNVEILNRNWLRNLPNLQTLIILDSRIVVEVLTKFFKRTLTSFQIMRSYCSIPLLGWEDRASLGRVLGYLPRTLRHLSLDFACGLDLSNFSNLLFLQSDMSLSDCYNHVGGDKWKEKQANKSLTTLICPPDRDFVSTSEYLYWKNLQHLRITSGVGIKEKTHLEYYLPNLRTLDIHCFLPPVNENQILTLNDDCLLRILSFLKETAWAAMSDAHPRFSRLISAHILPCRFIDVDQYAMASRRSKEIGDDQKTYAYLGKYVKHAVASGDNNSVMKTFFTQLNSLHANVDECSNYQLNEYPKGIKRLKIQLNNDIFVSLKTNFRKLNPTLTSLNLFGSFIQDDLMELHNIRKFEAKKLVNYDLIDFLTLNKDHLESLKINLQNYEGEDESDYDGGDELMRRPRNFALCYLKNLTVLHLTDMPKEPVVELKAKDLPALIELTVSFKDYYKPKHQALLNSIAKIKQLKSLSVWFKNKDLPVEWLQPLQNLKVLGINVTTNTLIKVLEQLPQLTILKWYSDDKDWSFPCEMSFESYQLLRSFLVFENRKLSIYFRGRKCLELP